jgi:predicted RNA-binding protein with PIN domain
VSRDHYIVDGYNVLHAHPVHAREAQRDLDNARAHLVADLTGFAENGHRTIVVFDGAGNPFSDGSPHHLGALTVIFSAAGTSADSVIEALAQRYRERGEPAVVVTSDTATRDTARSGTVSVLTSEHFVRDLLVAPGGDGGVPGAGTRRVPVARRIDRDVSDVLAGWARGRPPQGSEKP